MNSWRTFFKKHPVLTYSLGIVLIFSVYVFLFTSKTFALIEETSLWIRGWFGHYYLYLGLICVLFLAGTGPFALGENQTRPSSG